MANQSSIPKGKSGVWQRNRSMLTPGPRDITKPRTISRPLEGLHWLIGTVNDPTRNADFLRLYPDFEPWSLLQLDQHIGKEIENFFDAFYATNGVLYFPLSAISKRTFLCMCESMFEGPSFTYVKDLWPFQEDITTAVLADLSYLAIQVFNSLTEPDRWLN